MRKSDGLRSLDRGLEILHLLAERPHTVEELGRKLRTPQRSFWVVHSVMSR